MTHRIAPVYRRVMRLCGIASGLIAALAFAVLILDRPASASSDVTMALVAIAFGAIAWWCFRFYRMADRYTVETSDYGIRIASGEPVPWSSIAAVRERRVNQRLDLLDAGGRKLGAVEYQLEAVQELLREVRRRSRISKRASASTVYGKRRSAAAVALNVVFLAVFCGMGVWLWLDTRHWLGLALPPMVLWAVYTELRDDVRQVELRERDLAIRTFLRETLISRDLIADADLTLRRAAKQQQVLSSELIFRDGTVFFLRPSGVDTVELTIAIRRWLGTA